MVLVAVGGVSSRNRLKDGDSIVTIFWVLKNALQQRLENYVNNNKNLYF